jgi:hypothetical protein
MAKIGRFGQDWTEGVLSEGLDLPTRRLASGTTVAVDSRGHAHRVLCSEIVMIVTEDGRMDGRCGGLVTAEGEACPGHAAQLASWRGQSEAEALAWERELDRI